MKTYAYKLVRKLKNGDIAPLFINKTQRLQFNKKYYAEMHETKGFKVRKGWHCCATPDAPHLSKKGRIWVKVLIDDYKMHVRPDSQGGLWYTANEMTITQQLNFLN